MFDAFAKANQGRNAETAVEVTPTDISETERNSGIAVAEFIEAVNNMLDVSKQTKRKKKIGTLSSNHVLAINNLMKTINLDFDATGYEVWIDGTSARHIEIRHGKNGEADKSMASKEAKELIPWAAQNAEKSEFIKGKGGSISRSDRFFNSDGSRAPEIRLEKSTPDGKIYVSECVPDSANKRIWITSAYINKKGSKGQLLNIEDTSSPQPTPEASFDSNATDISISQNEDLSTDSAKKVSKSARKSSDFEAKLAEYKKPITHNDILTLRSIGRKSVNEFTSADIDAAGKWAYKFYKELGTKSPFFRAWFGDWRSEQKNKGAPYIKTINGVNVSSSTQGSQFVSEGLKNGTLFRGDVVNDDTKFKINIGAQVYNDTLTYASRSFSRDKDADAYSARLSLLNGIKAIAETSVLFDTETLKKDETNPDRTFVHKFYSVAKINSKHYLVKLTVDELNAKSGTIRRAYNVNNIEISPIAVSQVYKPAGAIGDSGEFFSTYSISDLFGFVKTYDKEFKPKSVNPALLNKDGTLEVFDLSPPNPNFSP